MKKPLLTCIISFYYILHTMGQDITPRVVNTSGGTFRSGNIIYEWSVGELPLINEMQSLDEKNTITNGFIQGTVAAIKRDTVVKPIAAHEISILPNPTRGKLQVSLSFLQTGTVKLMMYDETGFVVYKKEVAVAGHTTTEIIHINDFSGGNYFLVVEFSGNNNSNKKRQSYKIIKIH